MNVEVFRRTAQLIRENPQWYDQLELPDGDPRDCGAPCCVFGWAMVADERLSGDPWNEAVEALDLRIKSGEADRLYACFWPANWFDRAGLIVIHSVTAYLRGSPCISPLPLEAAAILEGMADSGYVWGTDHPVEGITLWGVEDNSKKGKN